MTKNVMGVLGGDFTDEHFDKAFQDLDIGASGHVDKAEMVHFIKGMIA